jgi:hypothetical protein
MLMMGVVYLFAWKLREKIMGVVKALIKKFFWNGHIRCQDISFLQQSMAVGSQITLTL